MKILKPLALTILAALVLTSSNTVKDKEDHSLTALWKEYYAAESADKPKTQEDVLVKIKKEAKSQHLTWDYYDASCKLAQVRISRNWKLREQEITSRNSDIKSFGEPVAEYFLTTENYGWTTAQKREFVEEHARALKAAHNPEFYKRDWHVTGRIYGDILPDMLANDYQYCLWSILDTRQLMEEFKDYPLSAFAEFEQSLKASGNNEDAQKKAQLEAFAKKWNGKAAALLAEEQLLSMRFGKLISYEDGKMKGTSDEFKALRDDCLSLNRKKSAFTGDEKKIAACCNKADSFLSQMNEKSVSVNVLDSKMTVHFRNLDAVSAQVLRGREKVWEKRISNPYKSYFAEDETSVELPDLPDGEYLVKCFEGKTSDETEYKKYTISASMRKNSDGFGVWATDYLSGEPLENVDLELVTKDKTVEKASIILDGYTEIPASMQWRLADKKGDYSIRVRSGQRASEPMSIYNWQSSENDRENQYHALFISDRRAYSPGDTMKFKAIVYSGYHQKKSAKAGLKITVELKDPEHKQLEKRTYTTNEFGSIAGEMVLKRAGRNGMYDIYIVKDGNYLTSSNVRVDDFILPTFDLVFDKQSLFERPVSEIKTGGNIYSYSGHSLTGSTVRYTVKRYGSEWASGQISPDKEGRFDITFTPDSTATRYDSYTITVKVTDASGETMEWNKGISIAPVPTPDTKKEYYFKEDAAGLRHGKLSLKVVAGNKPVWMVVEAHGPGEKLLWKRVEAFRTGNAGAGSPRGTRLSPLPGADGSAKEGSASAFRTGNAGTGSPRGTRTSPLPGADGSAEDEEQPAMTEINYELTDSDPEVAKICVIYFQNKECYSHVSTIRKEDHSLDLPLEFTRFQDTTVPGSSYSFEIKTLPGVECAASIFDKSTTRFAVNNWSNIRNVQKPAPSVLTSTVCGYNGSYHNRIMVRGLATNRMMSKAAAGVAADDALVVQEEAIPFLMVEQKTDDSGAATTDDIPIRENFANTIAWEPFLRSGKDGAISLNFTNADKLSTYYVQLFAHDKAMHNETLRREMVVTIPVKISLAEPKFLYGGDKYSARIVLSSAMQKDVRGTLTVQLLNGSDYKTAPVLSTDTFEVSVPAKESVTKDVEITVPDIDNLGIKAVFRPVAAGPGADAIFVSVPVQKPVQTLTEAHSAILLAGADKAALEASLRAMFENVDGSVPELQEIDIRQMLKDALPSELKPGCDNAISLARALYAFELCRKLNLEPAFDREGISGKLLACRNEDGGFGWFAGMSSSAMVTAVVLRLVHGLGIVDETAAVHYIDKRFFASDKSGWWYRGLSLEQYLHTRSFFPEISFEQKTDSDFRKDAKAWLVPSKVRGLNGKIAFKARRVQTLDNLLSLEGGTALASKLGIKLGTASKLRKSLEADIESLTEYAQPHKSGGVYYPNAVMPWRGLLETELDAHCALMAIMDAHGHGEIANGIRLWIMVQKETQDWKQDPGFIEALGAVLNGPESILQTKVLALKATYTLPFGQIRASGNGMTIARDGRSAPAMTGASSPTRSGISVGDRIELSYTVTNEENRSFVKVTIPFGAGLVPVNQLSGYRWGYYRNVLSDRIECWYEVYPEEKTSVSEEFYVTRAGSFQAPVATIECEYAPHYRANDAWNGRLDVSAQ